MIFLKKGKGAGPTLTSGDKCAVAAGSYEEQSVKIGCTLAGKTRPCGPENCLLSEDQYRI